MASITYLQREYRAMRQSARGMGLKIDFDEACKRVHGSTPRTPIEWVTAAYKVVKSHDGALYDIEDIDPDGDGDEE